VPGIITIQVVAAATDAIPHRRNPAVCQEGRSEKRQLSKSERAVKPLQAHHLDMVRFEDQGSRINLKKS
jgi:hypothetical protein